MSSVDNRIVRMQFDNAQFERGVMQSMRTLDELNEKLQFKEAGKGISALQVHLNNVDFSGIQNAIEHINYSFTSMTGMVAQRIKTDIVDTVVDAAKRLEQVTLGQIKSGGKARAQNIANAKFMIEGLKFDWEAVKQAADYAVTDTAYGLDAAAKAASQLAASGVDFQETIETVNGQDLTQMHKSLRAISGVAAMTNASYEEISHIFTSVAGMGKLTAMQMNQLSLRGLNIASTIGKETGKTEAEIRDMVSKGQISFQMFADAMDSAYGEHAKDANKTFQGSFSNLKAALSRIGAIFQQPVIDKTNTFFVAVTKRVKEFQAALNDETGYRVTEKALAKINKEVQAEARNLKKTGTEYARYVKEKTEARKKELLDARDQSINSGDVEKFTISRFATHFAEAWEAAIQFVSKVTESLDLSWFKSIGSFLDGAAIKVTNFFNAASKAIDKVKESVEKASDSISDALNLDVNDLNLLHRVLGNEFGYMEDRWKKLDDIYAKAGSKKTGKWLQDYMDQLAAVGYDFKQLGWTEEEFKKKEEELAKTEAQRVVEMSDEELLIKQLGFAYNRVTHVMKGVKTTVGNVVKSLWNVATAIGKVITYVADIRTSFQLFTITDAIADFSSAVLRLSEAVQPSVDHLQDMGDAIAIAGDYMSSVVEFVSRAATSFVDFVASCLKAEESLEDLAKNESLTYLQRSILNVMITVKNVGRFYMALGKIAIKAFKTVKAAFDSVFGGNQIGGALSAVTGGVASLSDGIATIAEKIADSEAPFAVLERIFKVIFTIVHGISDAFGKFTAGIRKFKNGTEDAVEVASGALKEGEKGQALFEKLGQLAAKGFDWVSDLPGKFEVLWGAIKKQEGVQRLKKSLEDLWDSVKGSFGTGMDTVSKSMGEFAKATGGDGETTIGALADGIGKVAGKIADFVDMLPVWGKSIKDFFTGIRDDVVTAYNTVKDSSFVQSIANAFGGTGGVFDTLKAEGKNTADALKESFKAIDWSQVVDVGSAALTVVTLLKLWLALDGITSAVTSFTAVPSALAGVFTSIKTVLGSFGKAIKTITTSYQIGTIALSIAAMAGALYLLSTIDGTALSKAEAALLVIAATLMALAKFLNTISFMNSVKITNVGDVLNVIVRKVITFAGIALVIASIGVAVRNVANALKIFSELNQSGQLANSFLAFVGVVSTILGFMAIVGGLVVAMSHLYKGDPTIMAVTFAGFGVVVVTLGIAVKKIAEAMALFDGVSDIGKSFKIILGIIATMTVATIVLMKFAKGLDISGIFAVAAMMLVISGAVALLCVAISGMALIISGFNVMKQSDSIKKAFVYIMSAIVVMALAITFISSSIGGLGKGQITGVILGIGAMIAFVLSVAFAFAKVASLNGDQLAGAVIALVVVLGAIVAAFMVLNSIAEGSFGGDSKSLLGIGIAFVAISASLYILAQALNAMSSVSLGGILLLAGAILAIGGAIFLLAKFAPADGITAVAKAFIAFGAGFLLAGAGLFVMAMAITKLLPLIPVLLIDVGMFFEVLENHWMIIALLTVAVIALAVAFGSMAAVVAPVVQGVVKVMTASAEIILDLISKVGSGLGKWFSELPTKGKKRIVVLITTICGALIAAGPKVVETIGKLLIMVLKYLGSIIGDIAYALLGLLINLVNGLANAIRMHANRILAAVYNVLLALVDVVIAALKLIVNHLLGDTKVGKTIADWLDKGMNKLDDKAKKALADAEAADAAAEANWNLAESVKDLSDAEGDYQKVHDSTDDHSKAGGGSSFLDTAKDKVASFIGPTNKSDSVETKVPNNLAEEMQAKASGNKAGSDIMGYIQDGMDSTGLTLPAMNGDTVDYENFDMSFMQDEIDDSKSSLYKSTESAVQDGPVAAIEDSEPMIRKSTQEHVMDVIKGVVEDDGNRKQLQTRSWVNGQYVAEGTANGVLDNLFKISDAMSKAAYITNNDFVGPMKIESPSKVMYQNGAYIIQGLADGMEANEYLATKASTDLSNSIVNSFRDPLSYIGQMSSGQLQYDPTIRPVLDSSNIGRGAGAINSMFRNQNVSLSGFSGQLAADIGQLDSRNSDVVEELRALREEMGVMGEQISQMQIVMDTGALVGATAGPMDQALGQRRVRFGRG